MKIDPSIRTFTAMLRGWTGRFKRQANNKVIRYSPADLEAMPKRKADMARASGRVMRRDQRDDSKNREGMMKALWKFLKTI